MILLIFRHVREGIAFFRHLDGRRRRLGVMDWPLPSVDYTAEVNREETSERDRLAGDGENRLDCGGCSYLQAARDGCRQLRRENLLLLANLAFSSISTLSNTSSCSLHILSLFAFIL